MLRRGKESLEVPETTLLTVHVAERGQSDPRVNLGELKRRGKVLINAHELDKYMELE